MNLCDIPKVLIFCDISQTHKCCDLDHLKPHMYLVNRCKAYLTNVDGLLFFRFGDESGDTRHAKRSVSSMLVSLFYL